MAAKGTEAKINESRETYREASAEAAMLYFLLTQLCNINPMYQFSLDSFVTFLYKVTFSRLRSHSTILSGAKAGVLFEKISKAVFFGEEKNKTERDREIKKDRYRGIRVDACRKNIFQVSQSTSLSLASGSFLFLVEIGFFAPPRSLFFFFFSLVFTRFLGNAS